MFSFQLPSNLEQLLKEYQATQQPQVTQNPPQAPTAPSTGLFSNPVGSIGVNPYQAPTAPVGPPRASQAPMEDIVVGGSQQNTSTPPTAPQGETVGGLFYKNGVDAFNSWINGGVQQGGIDAKEQANLAKAVQQGKLTQEQYNSILGPSDGLMTPKWSTEADGVRDFSDKQATEINKQYEQQMFTPKNPETAIQMPNSNPDDVYNWYQEMKADPTKVSDLSYRDQLSYHYLYARDPDSGVKQDGDSWRKYVNEQQSRLAQEFGLPQQVDVGDGKLDAQTFYGKKSSGNPFEEVMRSDFGGYYDLDGDMGKLGRTAATVGPALQLAAGFIPGMQPFMPLVAAGLTGATGGSLKDALKSGLTSYIGSKLPGFMAESGLGKIADIGELLQDQTILGDLARGGFNEVLKQAAQGDLGDLTVMDVMRAAGVSGLSGIGQGLIKDALRTNDYKDLLEAGGVDEDGNRIDVEDALRMEDTTSLRGLLGKNGLLSKIGIDVDYMPTDYIGGTLDKLFGGFGQATRPIVVDPEGKEYRVIEGTNNANDDYIIDSSGNKLKVMDLLDKGWESGTVNAPPVFIKPNETYDQRFIDPFAKHGNNPMTGTFEKNPYGNTGNLGDVGVPNKGTDYKLPSGTKETLDSIVDKTTPEELDLLKDTINQGQDVLAPVTPGDTELPSGGDNEIPVGGDEDIVVVGGSKPADTNLPSSGVTTPPMDIGDDEIPTGSDNEDTDLPGGGNIGGMLSGLLAGGASKADWENFWFDVQYQPPEVQQAVLQQLNYLAEAIKQRKAQQ